MASSSDKTTTAEAKRVQVLTIATTILVSPSFLSKSREACRKRPLSSGVPWVDLMLFWPLCARFKPKPPKQSERPVRRYRPPEGGRKGRSEVGWRPQVAPHHTVIPLFR